MKTKEKINKFIAKWDGEHIESEEVIKGLYVLLDKLLSLQKQEIVKEIEKEIQERIDYEKKYRLGDYTNGFSQLESGECCDKCAMDKKEVIKSGSAVALKLLVGCRNPFQLKEICQCHIPFRKVAVDVKIETFTEIIRLLKQKLTK